MIYFIWAVFVHMAPFKIVTLDDMWDQMNRSYMYVLCVTLACFIDFGLISGSTIKCIGFEEVYADEFVEDYCWTQGIYTIREAYDTGDANLPYPGVVPEEVPPCLGGHTWDGATIECPDAGQYVPLTRVYHLWYQFVQFYFWAASALFYMPYMMYICLDIAYIKPLIKMLHNPITCRKELDDAIDKAARWVRMRFDVYTDKRCMCILYWMYKRNALFITVISTKLIYLFYSVGMMYLTHKMFKIGSFASYGFDWVGSRPENYTASTLVQDKLFPKMVACEIKRWGTTGIDRTRGMCVLPQNVSNSYIFLVFWAFLWMTIVGNVIGIMITLFRFLFVSAGYSNLVSMTFHHDKKMQKLYQDVGSSGRIILHQLAQNLHQTTFEKLIKKYRWLKKHEYVEYNGHLKIE